MRERLEKLRPRTGRIHALLCGELLKVIPPGRM
jgi:hypothetical protein